MYENIFQLLNMIIKFPEMLTINDNIACWNPQLNAVKHTPLSVRLNHRPGIGWTSDQGTKQPFMRNLWRLICTFIPFGIKYRASAVTTVKTP